jgi:putative pre-16S rRNA nuclease
MKLLGIDYGLAKIGLALADDTTKMAIPVKILKETDLNKQVDFIQEYIKNEEIGLVVVGLPMSLQQNETEQTGHTRKFITALQEKGIEVQLEDERLSSKAAQKLGIKEDDAVAAMQILQTYIDRN